MRRSSHGADTGESQYIVTQSKKLTHFGNLILQVKLVYLYCLRCISLLYRKLAANENIKWQKSKLLWEKFTEEWRSSEWSSWSSSGKFPVLMVWNRVRCWCWC